ncbi:hypothetical protein MUK42_04255 [Musa troglodytarum]|uniref:Uncharacterized protein n=1 Tax=Musa troglodytarum TaxID=320322 RepID=A0A9E7G1G9_9LILI|nr:hypothetical protein MUK42_04255 [Musa troglodytarum]
MGEPSHRGIMQKVVFTVSALVDVKSKQRVMEAVADIHGVDTIAADFEGTEDNHHRRQSLYPTDVV